MVAFQGWSMERGEGGLGLLPLFASLGFLAGGDDEEGVGGQGGVVVGLAVLFRAGPTVPRRSSPDPRLGACPIQSQATPVQGSKPPDGAFHPLAATVSSPASSQNLQGLTASAPCAKPAMDAGMTGPTQHQSFSQVFR